MAKTPKILICRNDNLGDLLLSLPAIELVSKSMPEAEVALLAKSTFLNLLGPYLESKKIKAFSSVSEIQQANWDGFLSLFSDSATAFWAFRKKIPHRMGNYSRVWSFLLFNEGLIQRRSLAEKNEADYSLDLARVFVEKLGRVPVGGIEPIVLPKTSREMELAEKVLEKSGIKEDTPFIILHPGMAGSALNLDSAQYEKIVLKLRSQFRVLVSVGPSHQDQAIWKDLCLKIPDLKKVEGLDLAVLKEVFRMSQAVIAPSTGPLHLAHLVGTRAIGIYSPIKSQHPTRWAPKGGKVSAKVLFPEMDCPAKKVCLGESCPVYNCMEQIDWSSLILKQLDGLT